MIVFITLFLALSSGTEPVSVAVEEPVATVELRLDGRRVAEIRKAPWSAEVDFGPLRPHRLEAVGYDADGEEVDRAVQLVNVPHSRAESHILLDRDPEGRVREARLLWDTVENLEVERAEVRFDGRPLEVSSPRAAIAVPKHDPDRQHHLVAELVFEGGLRTETAAGFGGVYGDRVSTELTALAVRRRGKGPLVSGEEMAGWFLHDGEPVPVRAVETTDPKQGGADYVVARNEQALLELRRVAQPKRGGGAGRNYLGFTRDVLRRLDRGFLVQPVAESEASLAAAKFLFPLSPPLTRKGRGGLTWLLTGVRFRGAEVGVEQLAQATAVAGLTAARGRPRAVVAVLHPDSTDASGVSWKEVRRYLETLRVPLHLWTPADPELIPEDRRAEIGDVRPVRYAHQFREAVRDLRQDVDSQAVVWVEGIYLPREIELSDEAREHVEWVR
jgi:hypothetical protein